MMYTGGGLLLYLLLCGCPLDGIPVGWSAHSQSAAYGVGSDGVGSAGVGSVDPLHSLRPMLGARGGSLMELGISPMVSAQFVLQLLAGSGMMVRVEKAQLHSVQKLLSLLIALGEAVAFVASGAYGHWLHELGAVTSLLMVAQLCVSSLLLLLLDEVIQRGWGLGSGSNCGSLFIATNICTDILWRCASPLTLETPRGIQYEGALVALIHLALTGKSLRWALREAFYRTALPNLGELLATVLLLALTVLLQGLRVELPVKSQKLRGQQSQTKYPIKLLYTSNVPILLHTALVSNVFLVSQMVSHQLGGRLLLLTNVLGRWRARVPVGGLSYYMASPRSVAQAVRDPIHCVVSLAFVVGTCSLISLTWLNVSGSAPKDVAKQLKEQGLVIRGYREHATHQVLERYIPTAALLGGVCIALLSVLADIIGAVGSGASILLVVTIIFEMFETYVREAQASGMQLNVPGMNF